tara:strand:- start:1651 stop:4053 length:2403 start_codon:yes stop_codon:yes gene_type:complete
MGGLGGHMAHLSEDLDLTFNELVDVLGKVARAEIKTTTEKVDGQNLFLSVDDEGNIRTARNAGDIKRGGMTPTEYAAKWEGHPAGSAFTNGFKAITAALKSIDVQKLRELFSNGQRYINMEIMYPKNPNIIQYTAPHIVIHDLKYVGDSEDVAEEDANVRESLEELVELVKGAEIEVDEELWTINGPTLVALKELADGTALGQVTQEIESIAEPVGMDATLGDLVELRLHHMGTNEGLPADIINEMIFLILSPDEAKKAGISTVTLKRKLPKELKPVISRLATKTTSRKVIASILYRLEVVISDFAIEVLRGLKSFFVSNHDEEVIRQREELERSIEYLQALSEEGNVDMGELVDKQLAKLKDVENVASSMEGVVFEHPPGSGKIYKLTGAFAMANQIIGRARRSGMQESVQHNFTIQISEKQSITKPLTEWLYEMKAAKHQIGKVPGLVYSDILNRVPLVDIVSQEDAQEVIYNTVYAYATKALKEGPEMVLEIIEDEIEDRIELEDEDEDPVVDVEFTEEPETIALVAGAFKPPHPGHLDMVRRYAEGIGVKKADKVIVLISNPLVQQRTLDVPDEEPRPITAANSEAIWKLLVADMPNVEVDKSPMASPVQAVYEYIGPNGPLAEGTRVILGASKKPDDNGRPDWMRWENIQNNQERYLKPGIVLENIEENAVPATEKKDGTPYRARDFRDLISACAQGKDPAAMSSLVDFVGCPVHAKKILQILNIGAKEPIEEMSGMAGGAVGGFSAPFGRSLPAKKRRRGKKKRKKKRKKKNENVDLTIVDEIFKLLTERGILT